MKCWIMHNILMSLYPNPNMTIQLNLEGGQLCCLTDIKGPHEWPVYCHLQIYFWRLWQFLCWFILLILFLMSLFTPSKTMTNPSLFSSRSWDLWLYFKLLCTVFFHIYPCTCYWISKLWWDNLCLLGLTWILWMYM